MLIDQFCIIFHSIFEKWNNKKVCTDRLLKETREKTYLDLVEVKQIKENLEKGI